MLMPKRTKYRRPHRLSYEGRAKAGREVSFGQLENTARLKTVKKTIARIKTVMTEREMGSQE